MTNSPFIIGTAGHIDHGKTSLVKAITGVDTDRLKEEKERGISIDLGFAYFDLPDGRRCGIVDVPGHERFIKNMLAGAGGFDMVLFVVAADDGIMPQTKEHLEIMHLLNVRKGMFVLTKVDLVDRDRVKSVKRDLKLLAEKTSNNFRIVSFSFVTGEGLEHVKKEIYSVAKEIVPRPSGGFFRLPIDRSFSIKGFGAVVTGTAASGRIKKGSSALILPQGFKVKIRGLQSHNENLDEIRVGQRAAVNISGISHNEIKRGDSLVSEDLTKGTAFADVRFEFLNSMEKAIKNFSRLKLHHLARDVDAMIIFEGTDKADAGETVFGKVRLKSPLVMMRGDRFILRDTGKNRTIGGGVVLLPFGMKREKNAHNLNEYQILERDDLSKLVLYLLNRKDFCMDRHAIRLQMNITDEDLSSLILKSGGIKEIDNYLVFAEKLAELKEKIIRMLKEFHTDKPEEIEIDEAGLYAKSAGKVPFAIFKKILDEMVSEGIVERGKGYVLLKGFRKSSEVKNQIEEEIIRVFRSKGFSPPRADELKEIFRGKYSADSLQKSFHLLVKKGVIIRIAENEYLLKDTIEDARNLLVIFFEKNDKVKAAEFRDILACGRKIAIEILEYFDKERFTLRTGDYRVLRKK
ncbi:MAG: selenocysteine-specific translation elongation factor [Deltaproteobacteria bacterium GWC2_42_11]|nr:MAG: selenocysteine-specific translation elongation factor [Deltaproteobacteria bacterium GWC2_42_11]